MLADGDVDADQKNSITGSDLPLPKVLAALASILRDSTGRFEETSDRITQLVVARESGSGVDIIVALQEFDRLRQDFEAIEGILAGCAQVIERSGERRCGPSAARRDRRDTRRRLQEPARPTPGVGIAGARKHRCRFRRGSDLLG